MKAGGTVDKENLFKWHCRMAEKEIDKAIGYYEGAYNNALNNTERKKASEQIRKLKEIK